MKVTEWFSSCNSLLLYACFLVIVSWHFQIKRFFPFSVIVPSHFHKWKLFSFLVGLYKISCFSDSIVQKTTQQSDRSCKVIKNSRLLYKFLTKNSLFNSVNTHKKYIVSKENSIAGHVDKVCFLPICSYHIKLIGNNQELLQNLNALYFNYEQVDCLYTLFMHRFSGKNVLKSGQLFDNLQRAVHFKHQNRGMQRMPSFAKKKLMRKRYKSICWDPSKRPNWRKLLEQSLQTELNKLERLSSS